MTTKIVHRISLPNVGRSMWYDRDGLFSPVDEVFAAVPMELDPFRLHLDQDGTGEWLSAVDDPTKLELWFPNTRELLAKMGFIQHTFIARHWHDLPDETVFDLSTATEITA